MEQKTIMLESAELGVQEFTLEHAQSLIQIEHKIGKSHWVPVKDSHYTIQDGSLIKIKNTGVTDNAKEQRPNSEGSTSGS